MPYRARACHQLPHIVRRTPLKEALGLSVSAAIEANPVLSEQVILEALDQCVGGRSNNRELLARRGSGFLMMRLSTDRR